jgi:tetratricopeptide (TPR) repeat protein
MSLRRYGAPEQSLELCQEALALLPADGGDDYATAYARVLVARGQGETGRFAPALEALESLAPQLARTGPEPLAQGARVMLAALWLPLGQPARAMALLAEEPAGMPTWLRAYRHQLRLELALALHRASPPSDLQDMLALADADASFGTSIRVHALRHVAPAQVMVDAGALRATLATTEFDGVKMALDVHVARAALALGRTEDAARCAEQLIVRFDEGCAPDAIYRAEAWWVAAQALAAAGHTDRASVALRRGTTWVTQHALPHVPPPFIDSFLHRNPINRDLLAFASR